MERNIGKFTYDSSFSRNNLSSKINGLVNHDYNIGLHSIGFTDKNKQDVAAEISKNGLNIYNNLSAYSTVRFFGHALGNNDRLNSYIYDQTDNKEVILVIAIPETFTHSSGQTIKGGKFPELSVGDAKRELDGFYNYMNESDRVLKPIPPEMILGCYTFDKRDVKYESRTISKTIMLPDGRATVVYEIDPYYKANLGLCDFYINPNHYSRLPQEAKDLFIAIYFGHKLKSPDKEIQLIEKPRFYVKRRTFNNKNQ